MTEPKNYRGKNGCLQENLWKMSPLGLGRWVGIIVLISTGTFQLHLALYPDKKVCKEKLYSCIFYGLCLLWWGIGDFILLVNFCVVYVEELTLLYEQAFWVSRRRLLIASSLEDYIPTSVLLVRFSLPIVFLSSHSVLLPWHLQFH